MVRHTEPADDESTSTTRRTRADLRYLAEAGHPRTHKLDPEVADDPKRNARLREHGWVGSQGSLTGDGDRLASVVRSLTTDDDTGADDFEWVVDIMGMNDFVDAAISAPNAEDAGKYFRSILALANRVDEARHTAGTQDVEPEHDGLFAPHFVAFDARRGTVEMAFNDVDTADVYADEWVGDRNDGVQAPTDPTTLYVDVTDDR